METDEGQDPLDLTITHGHIECAAMLCQAGLQIKQKHLQAAHDQGRHRIYNFLKRKATE